MGMGMRMRSDGSKRMKARRVGWVEADVIIYLPCSPCLARTHTHKSVKFRHATLDPAGMLFDGGQGCVVANTGGMGVSVAMGV